MPDILKYTLTESSGAPQEKLALEDALGLPMPAIREIQSARSKMSPMMTMLPFLEFLLRRPIA